MELNRKNLKEIRRLLEVASDAYYNTDRKIMSDEEFDKAKEFYERESGETLSVGAPPKSGKKIVEVEHSYAHLVGTLDKVNSIKEFREWIENRARRLGVKTLTQINCLLTPKHDGNSVVIAYDGGKVVSALTRGRGGRGADMTKVFRKHRIGVETAEVGIQYEVVIPWETFDKIVEEGGRAYANPRSMVAGFLGDANPERYAKYLKLIPLNFAYKHPEIFQATSLNDGNWFRTVFSDPDDPFVDHDAIRESRKSMLATTVDILVQEVEEYYETHSKLRAKGKYPWMIDGIVFEFLDPKIREKLGRGDRSPNYAVALKFPYMEKETVAESMEYDIGNTGRITPCLKFTPVEFNGAVQKRVSIANYKRFHELQLGKGSKVLIQYRNECLSYVESIDKPHPKPFVFPANCPECGGPVEVRNETLAYCTNRKCSAIVVGKIERYLKKLDVQGVRFETLMKLYKHGVISGIAGLYRLEGKADEVSAIPGLGKKTYEAIVKAMSKTPWDYEVLAGIGIRDFGLRLAKEVCKRLTLEEISEAFTVRSFDLPIPSRGTPKVHLNGKRLKDGVDFHYFPDDNNIVLEAGSTKEDQIATVENEHGCWEWRPMEKIVSELESIPGFGESRVSEFLKGMTRNAGLLRKLLKVIPEIKCLKKSVKSATSGKSLVFVVTGDVTKWKNRKELQAWLESRGHRVAGSVTSKTDYLITNDPGSGSVKNLAARKFGVKVIGEDEVERVA